MSPAQVLQRFIPARALGAGVDGHERGDIAKLYTPSNLKAMRAMGLRSLTYRLRTELGIEAWHWNPDGMWSDPKRREGYWLSNAHPGKPIEVCYGYSLPRRGSTFDQANNRGYSRLDDGDPRTFWKSNPYLDRRFTGEPNSLHPQWVVIDFGESVPLDYAKIVWAAPYATRFRFEYWKGGPRIDEVDPKIGQWTAFPFGNRAGGRGGLTAIRLGSAPVRAQYVRLWLQESSDTALPGSHDVRDRLGFAIREISLGTRDARGVFHDAVVHRRDSRQTEMIVSSTDPWHRAVDRDPDTEQPGFDRVERSGLANGLPMLTPVPVLFGDPADAANELLWLRARHYPVRAIEMGEEPDGQMTLPADYAALYVEVADKLRRVDRRVVLGGPCFQTTQHEFRDWPDPHGTPWLRGFLSYLSDRKRLKDLGFFSFEWYPFDDVSANPTPQLLAHQAIFDGTIKRLMSQGLTHDVPWMITEYGYSAFAGPSEVELPGAILNADIVGEFLSMGGSAAFLYGYEPGEVIQEHTGAWGNLMALMTDPDSNALVRLPTYYSAWLMTHAWCGDQTKEHRLVRTAVDSAWVGAYSVVRPDGRLAVMLVNRSPDRAASVSLRLPAPLAGRPAVLYQYGTKQYAWKPDGENGRPLRSLPPNRSLLPSADKVDLPPWSVSVVVTAVLPGNSIPEGSDKASEGSATRVRPSQPQARGVH